jgi:hypothetical protein
MPGVRGRALLSAAVAAALLGVAGCGGGDEGQDIPQAQADAMLATIDEIQASSDQDECGDAQAATTELRNQVADLDNGETKQALDAMITRLDENLDDDCVPTGTSPDADTEEPAPEEEPVEPAPVEPETEPAPVEPETEPAPEEDEPPTPEQPPGEGGGPNGPAPPGGGGGGGGSTPPTGGVDEG